MNLQKILVPVAGVAAVAAAYYTWGWQGVLLVLGGIVFWLLMHFNRALAALRRAANRPIGYVDSAVMLSAKLRSGVSMLHVISMTRSLGKELSAEGAHPELFCWADAGESSVTCEFEEGKLLRWKLERPSTEPDAKAEADGPAPAN